MGGAEDTVPQQSLLAVVVALAVSLAMVQIVIFGSQLSVEEAQEPAVGRWRRSVETNTRVTEKLREDNVLMADPPVIETHWKTHRLEREPSHERDDGDIEDLLFDVGIDSEERGRVLGQMVGAVVFPESVVLVHAAVVPVKPEVKDDSIESEFDWQPPAGRRWKFAAAVGKDDCHQRSEGRGVGKGMECLRHIGVWNLVALVLVTIQESVSHSQVAKHVKFMDGIDLECECVENEHSPPRNVSAKRHSSTLMKEHRPHGMGQNPDVALACRQCRHLVGLLVHRNRLVDVGRMNVQNLHGPVVSAPFFPVACAPCRLHRVLVRRGSLGRVHFG